MQSQSGKSLVELLVGVAVAAMFITISTSAIEATNQGVQLATSVSELRSVFQQVRALALARDRYVAIRFRPEGSHWSWTIYEDGDGDGVRNDDIARGTDRRIDGPRRFQFASAAIAIPEGNVPDPTAPGQYLANRLPVRFGTSMLCSFSPSGEASNGSIVLAKGKQVIVIRVQAQSARINVLRWDGRRWTTGT
ncbi:MAG TPA: GspH/FimT family pseudopilin [Thermoanaerobaculia bacterium]